MPTALTALTNLETLCVASESDYLSELLPSIPAQLLHLQVRGFVCDEENVAGLSHLTALRWLSFFAGEGNSIAPTTAWLPLLRAHRRPQLRWINFGEMIDVKEAKEKWPLSGDALGFINESLQRGSPPPPNPFWHQIRML